MNRDNASERASDIERILVVYPELPPDHAAFRWALDFAWRLGRTSGVDEAIEFLRGAPSHAS